MCLLFCAVTTFVIPTAKHVIGGRADLGTLSMMVSSESLTPFNLSIVEVFSDELDDELMLLTQLERISPVF